MSAPTSESVGLNGVNATVYARLIEQAIKDGLGWVCSCVLRRPHIGGEAKHSRIAEIRAALRSDSITEPIEKQATTCGQCVAAAATAKSEGRKPTRVYAYRLSPLLWNTKPLQGAFDLEGRRAS